MSANPHFRAGDLRGPSQSIKRERDHTAKWRRDKNGIPADRSILVTHEGFEKPRTPAARSNFDKHENARILRHNTAANIAHTTTLTHTRTTPTTPRPARSYNSRPRPAASLANSLDDSNFPASRFDRFPGSTVCEAPAFEGDDKVAYSYDHRGPVTGKSVMENAVIQAVERWEGKETDRIVREEYDDVGAESVASVAETEGYELV